MKVLIDHSVRQHAILAERGVVLMEDIALGQRYTYLRFETRHKPARADWLQPEIEALPKVAELIRTGRVLAFTTDELYAEDFRAAKFPSPAYIDAFEGCQFSHLPAPIERSKFGLSAEQFTSKEDVIAYCKCFFLTPNAERTEKFIEGMKRNPRYSLTRFEEKCLRNAPLFQRLCRGIAETHYPDALHLWTAEENGLDGFLTLDRKFRNIMEHQHVNLTCGILYPSELIAKT